MLAQFLVRIMVGILINWHDMRLKVNFSAESLSIIMITNKTYKGMEWVVVGFFIHFHKKRPAC